MPAFAWRKRATRHFGEQWVPIAHLQLQDVRGAWREFALQIDTGAVITTLARSAADLLGIDFQRGAALELVSVGGSVNRFSLHEVPARIGDASAPRLRIAFAEREDVPNLLGRLDILDRFQLDFDPSTEETHIRAPWLDADTRRIWRQFLATEAHIQSRWRDHPLAREVDECCARFMNRADQLVAAAAGLLKLQRDFELPQFARSLFDLTVQFEYLMQEPAARARLYLEFEHVTRFHASRTWTAAAGQIGDTLRASPARATGQAQIDHEYQRVRANYAAPGKSNRERAHWYAGTLHDLAAAVGRKNEYRTIYSRYSAWAHGDPAATRRTRVETGGLWPLFAYWAAILLLIAEKKQIILAADQYETLRIAAQGLIERDDA